MGYFKRAITSITRKMGKSVILLLLVFILGNVIAGAISISQSVKNTEEAVTKGIVPVATIETDWDKYNQNVTYDPETGQPDRPYPQLTADQIEQMGALPAVDYFDYNNSFYGQAKEIKRYYPQEYLDDPNTWKPDTSDPEYKEGFSIIGSQSSEFMDYKVGIIELVDGRLLSSDEIANGTNAVLVSKEFAEINSLFIGDTFTLSQDIWISDEASNTGKVEWDSSEYIQPTIGETLDFEFTIVGLYQAIIKPSTASNQNDKTNELYQNMERFNKIYTSNASVKTMNALVQTENEKLNPWQYTEENINNWGGNREWLTPYYTFKTTDDLDAFSKTYKDVVGEEFRVINNKGDFSKVIAPMKNMSKLADIVFYVGVGASLIILSLLITLFLRDRRNEIGIYLALGERKTKVVGQILAEVLIVAILGITLSLFSGNLISKQLSNSMMDNQIIAQQEKDAEEENGGYIYQSYNPLTYAGYGGEITLEQLAEQYDVSLSMNIILFFYGAGVITILLSTLIPIMYVLRLNPKKILM